MARRAGKTSTGGNVSSRVAASAKKAKRQGALDWLLEGATRMTDVERDALLAEIDGKKPRKKRARKAT